MTKKAEIEDLIKEAISLYSEDGTLKNEAIILFNIILYIIADKIKFPSDTINNREKRNLIMDALNHLKNIKNTSYEEFKGYIEEGSRKSGRKKYSIVFSLNLSKENIEGLTEINLDNKTLENVNKDDFCKKISKKFDLDRNLYQYFEKAEWCKVTLWAPDKESALNFGYSFSEQIRSLINFVLASHKIYYQYPPKPLASITPSYCYFLFDEGENYISHYYSMWHYDYKQVNISDKDFKKVINFIKEVDALGKSKEHKLKRMFLESLRLYNEALDSDRYEFSFIVLWSIVDILIPNIKNNKEYLKNFFREDKKWEQMIDALYNKRNLLIHQGKIFDVDLDDLNLLKFVIDKLLKFVFDISKDFQKPEQFEKLITNLSLDDEQLQENINILSYIKRKRY